MNVTIKQLKAFVAVAKTRSFAEAAELVYLSQPALSIAIKNLEETVGGTLLARSTRTLALTPEGEAFYPVAERLLADWDDAMLELHNLFSLKRGKLSIAAMPSFAGQQLPSVLGGYRQLYPDINVTVQDVVAEAVVEMVRSGRVEVGIAFLPDSSIDDLNFETLFEDRFVVALPADHPLLEKDAITWNQLKSYPFIALQRPSSIREVIERTLEEKKFNLNIELESHQLITIIRMVVCGLGVSVVPSLCIPQIEQLGGQWRPLKAPVITRKVGIFTRKRYPLSAAATAMIDVLRKGEFQLE
ncbi:LysR family transcriptional regulator [Pontibacterium sp. N1Y112]|uniref:LysR family transcriptional regulator n=1 Tax=Pontibacterium sinense TaxID=2781979 RepID=A0A8J7FR03_9GAMM|nr:LysR family transcriptional regulator [Pontibacterium sinense]MBE9398382.1 LysR family transcriptional regulator [Pontibacterium sinense]